ncbi:MAG: Plug domain-containing protein, partial [Duncaniella sp.]|nr:Plug domain-containing protein [Duncaniella sp.]
MLAYTPVVWAIDDVPDSVGSGLRLDNVQVTARRSSVRVSADMPVQTLSASRLAALGVADMSDAVRRFAGTNVRDYGGLGGLKTVSVRNMGAAHTAVSYDGVPVSNCQGGQIDIGQFSLDNVASLSLAVGHADDLLQPARLYASAAVLGINTMRPTFAAGHTTSFEAYMRAGAWGFLSPSARLWQRIGKAVTTSLDVGYTRSVGDYTFTLTNGNLVTRERRVNSALHSWRGEVNIYI